jgi:hypothetical protein
VTGAYPGQQPGVEVELGNQRRDEPAVRELPSDRLVHRGIRLQQRTATTPAVPVGRQRERGDACGREPVPHGVEDGDVQHPVVDRVVQRVAAVVVARLEHRRQREPVGREHERRSEAPHQLGCDRHRLPPTGHLKGVSVGRLRDDEDGDEMRVALACRDDPV